MNKLVLNKERMLSHVMNDGRAVASSDGCRCIKGAFLDGLHGMIPALPDSFMYNQVRYDKHMNNDCPDNWEYLCLLGSYRINGRKEPGFTPLWRKEHPEVVEVLDKYEKELMWLNHDVPQETRNDVLRRCVAELEEKQLVEWERVRELVLA